MVTYVPKYLRVYLLDDHDIVRQGHHRRSRARDAAP